MVPLFISSRIINRFMKKKLPTFLEWLAIREGLWLADKNAGRSPVAPQKRQGPMMLPVVSVAIVKPTSPAATAAAQQIAFTS
jgi:hypothetical protein